jgi:hypothetical protein
MLSLLSSMFSSPSASAPTQQRKRRGTNELTQDLKTAPGKYAVTHFSVDGMGKELNELGRKLDQIDFKSPKHISKAAALAEEYQSVRAMVPVAGQGPNQAAMKRLREISDNEARDPQLLAEALPGLRGKLKK